MKHKVIGALQTRTVRGSLVGKLRCRQAFADNASTLTGNVATAKSWLSREKAIAEYVSATDH